MLTEKEKAVNFETLTHIRRVQQLLNMVIVELIHRGEIHDNSKLESPEVELFTIHTERLKDLSYGTKEYDDAKKDLSVALTHHYANNRHHPEFHRDGINDMTLIDLIEMLVDWKAASERHNDGNIRKSIDINAERFNISPQLARIMRNTVDELF